MALGFLNRQRLWTVYGATGDSSRPLRPIACVRANAKSIARGIVARSPQYSHISKRRLAVVEGCFTSGAVLRGPGRRRRRRRRR